MLLLQSQVGRHAFINCRKQIRKSHRYDCQVCSGESAGDESEHRKSPAHDGGILLSAKTKRLLQRCSVAQPAGGAGHDRSLC